MVRGHPPPPPPQIQGGENNQQCGSLQTSVQWTSTEQRPDLAVTRDVCRCDPVRVDSAAVERRRWSEGLFVAQRVVLQITNLFLRDKLPGITGMVVAG